MLLGEWLLLAIEGHAGVPDVHCIKVTLSALHAKVRTRIENASRAYALTFHRDRLHKHQFVMFVLTGARNRTHF